MNIELQKPVNNQGNKHLCIEEKIFSALDIFYVENKQNGQGCVGEKKKR